MGEMLPRHIREYPHLEGATPEILLARNAPVWQVSTAAAKIADWDRTPYGPIDFGLSGGTIGQSLHFQMMTGGVSDVTTDIEGIWFGVISPYAEPASLVVLSGREPAVVQLAHPDWRASLAAAVINACQTPASYVDYELEYGGRYTCRENEVSRRLLVPPAQYRKGQI